MATTVIIKSFHVSIFAICGVGFLLDDAEIKIFLTKSQQIDYKHNWLNSDK